MFGMVMRASIAIAAVVAAFLVLPVHAGEASLWRQNQTFSTESSNDVRQDIDCYEVTAEVVQQSGATKQQKVCEQRGKNLTLGRYTDTDNKKYYAVKIGFDQYYRNIANVNAYDTRIYLRPSDDALIVKFPGAQKVHIPSFSIYRLDNGGIESKLSNGHGTIEYELDFYKRTTLMGLVQPDGSAYYTKQDGYAFSQNRQYLLTWHSDHSVVVTNTITGDMRIISAQYLSGKIDATISDDGRYAVLGTAGFVFDTQNCGETYDFRMHNIRESNGLLRTACPMAYIWDKIYSVANITYMGANFYFVDDNTALAFDFPRENPRIHGLIKTSAYNPTRLDYLALGDSYSSGEGDTEIINGVSYYTPVTDGNRGCHLSTRSYPFRLSIHGVFKTIRCSRWPALAPRSILIIPGNFLHILGKMTGSIMFQMNAEENFRDRH